MNNVNKSSDNVHKGHRERLRANIYKTGLYNLDNLHFLEYLLTFVIAREDTNPIAHNLLETFGTIDGIFNASVEALVKVKGVGTKTARFLQFMSASAYMYNRDRAIQRYKLDTLNKIIMFIQSILPPSDNEQFITIIVNKDLSLKTYKVFKGVSHSFISIDVNDLTDMLLINKAKFVIFAHTHPKHTAMPSVEDVSVFHKFAELTKALSINMVENIILGSEDFYSAKNNAFYKYDNYIDKLIPPNMDE